MTNGTQTKTSALAITALVFSLLMCTPLFPLLGVIFGIVAIVKIGKDPTKSGKGIAIAAVAVGAPALIVSTGVMAAVAIPAFIKYIRRAKTAEAEDRISMMYRSAVSYATMERVGPTGQMLPPQFPASAPLTPPQRCAPNPDGRCQPNPANWQHPTWQALNFSVDDPHYFQYEFVSDGRSFTARAIGDLDNDGVTSTFERSGEFNLDGTVTGSRGIYRERPME